VTDPKETTAVGAAERSALLRVVTDPWVRLGVLGAIVAAVVVWSLQGDGVSIAGLRDQVDGLGAAAPAVYIGLYALATTFLIPAAPFTVAAGLLFGPVPGTFIALAGATLGATGAFWLGRLLGRDAARQLGGRQVARIDRFLGERGFVAVLILRLVPLFPYNVINVSAGVTGLRTREYVLATFLGIIPGTVVYVALGGTITDPTSPTFLGALAAFGVLTVGAGLAARRMRGVDATPTDPEPDTDADADADADGPS
jgi:uncharacterized membrane protein YdjX (TVP38/TMEM64 family)